MKVHYNTLGELFQDIESFFNIELPLITGGIGYEETARYTFDVGHKTKRLHVQIYRLQSGRYEYNGYVQQELTCMLLKENLKERRQSLSATGVKSVCGIDAQNLL